MAGELLTLGLVDTGRRSTAKRERFYLAAHVNQC